MSAYVATDEVLVYLIKQTMDGSPERRFAAKFILDCLRKCQTHEEIVSCIRDLEEAAIFDRCQ